jgi:hypothetical protein
MPITVKELKKTVVKTQYCVIFIYRIYTVQNKEFRTKVPQSSYKYRKERFTRYPAIVSFLLSD